MEAATRAHTLAEYVVLEDAAATKSEFVNGQIVAMAGASIRHDMIASRILVDLGTGLRKTGCRPVGSDQRVHVLVTDLNTYPDVTVFCGKPQISPDDHHAIVNPTVLVEVLSPSTESHDRGAKWQHYQQIASLKEYLLVSSGAPSIERFARQDDGSWRYESLRAGTLHLTSCPASLDVAEVYADLPDE